MYRWCLGEQVSCLCLGHQGCSNLSIQVRIPPVLIIEGVEDRKRGRPFLYRIPGNRNRQPSSLADMRDQSPAASEQAAAPAPDKSPLRILVVEDEPLILMITIDMLETMGHTVFEAASAEEAISLLEQETIDVLLTDQGLPGMSGADLAVACRRQWPKLGVIFASGAVGIPQVDGYEVIAEAVILSKPYDDAALAAAIERVQVSSLV